MSDTQLSAQVQPSACPHCGYWISPALVEANGHIECPNCEAELFSPQPESSASSPSNAEQPCTNQLAFHRPESPELRSLFRLWLRIRRISGWVITTSILAFYFIWFIILPLALIAVLIYGLAGLRLEQILRQDRELKHTPP